MGDEAKALLGDLQIAVSEATALLVGKYFAGTTENLSAPFTLPEGPYRAYCRTTGSVMADIKYADKDETDYLFTISHLEAGETQSLLYRSNGERIMLEFSIVDGLYELWFEEIK
jgi:hypothetical protein